MNIDGVDNLTTYKATGLVLTLHTPHILPVPAQADVRAEIKYVLACR